MWATSCVASWHASGVKGALACTKYVDAQAVLRFPASRHSCGRIRGRLVCMHGLGVSYIRMGCTWYASMPPGILFQTTAGTALPRGWLLMIDGSFSHSTGLHPTSIKQGPCSHDVCLQQALRVAFLCSIACTNLHTHNVLMCRR